ncbi:translocase of chloroplast 159, chloroplastic [Tanacetum coccineum]
MDSSISANHGDNASIMVGFDIQPIGKQLAYIVKGETKFKNLKKNKTSVGISVTFLGENVVTGFKVEDQIALGRQYSIIGSASTVRFQTDYAYGANIEIQRRELDYQIGQEYMYAVQSSVGGVDCSTGGLSMSLKIDMHWFHVCGQWGSRIGRLCNSKLYWITRCKWPCVPPLPPSSPRMSSCDMLLVVGAVGQSLSTRPDKYQGKHNCKKS